MIEVSRSLVVAHRVLRPIAGARQVSPERLHTLKIEAIGREDRPAWQNTLEWLKLVGVGAVNPVATRSYDQGLVLASRLTDRNIIGAGLEVIVARDHMAGPKYPVTKYATKVNGDARYWCDELARRQDKVKKVMGKFVIDTEYDTGHLWGRAKPSLVPMYQPFINIVDEDGHNAPDMADQRGEFRELADKVASDHGYYFDVIEGHGNLVVHLDAGVRQLAVADMVVMSKADEVRPFVSFKPNPEEWASWLRSVHP